MFGSVVSLAMFYIKGRERDTEAFSFLRSLIYANLSFFLLGLVVHCCSLQVFDLPHWSTSGSAGAPWLGTTLPRTAKHSGNNIFRYEVFFFTKYWNIEHIVASFSQAPRQQYFQVLILPSFFLFSCFSSFSSLSLRNGVEWRENCPNQLAGVKDQCSISLTFLEQFVLVKKGTECSVVSIQC